MSVFFDVSTPENKALMGQYDNTFKTYRLAALGFLAVDGSLEEASGSLNAKALAVRTLITAPPLPSAANDNPRTFQRLVDLFTAENDLRATARQSTLESDQEALNAAFNSMSNSAVQTIARPEFAAINGALMKAAAQAAPRP